MKKFLIIALTIIIAFFSQADTIIEMEPYGGVYRIQCSINGAKMKLIFDTGASNVCISLPMAEYLFDNGYINANDIKGSGKSSVADGRIVNNIRIILKDIQIGNVHLHNVEAVVLESQNAPLLFGQSAIKKLGKFEIKGNNLIIHNSNGQTQEELIAELYEKLSKAIDNGLESQVIEYYGKLYSLNALDDIGIYLYAVQLYLTEDCDEALSVLNQIEDVGFVLQENCNLYNLLGSIYFSKFELDKAIQYYKRSIDYEKDPMERIEDKKSIGDSYYCLKDWKNAREWYFQAWYDFAKLNNVSVEYLMADCYNTLKKKQKSIRTDKIDYLLSQITICAYKCGEIGISTLIENMKKLAMANNRYARQYLRDLDLDFYD